MNRLFLAIMTAFFYGAYNIFIKISSGHINQIVGAVILQLVAALLGAIILIIMKLNHAPLEISQKGVLFAIIAGVFVGLAEITTFFVFAKGINASIGIPIIIGGSIIFGTILALTLLKENLTPLNYLAIAMIIGGIIILSIK